MAAIVLLARICLCSLSTPLMYYFSASRCGVKNLPTKQVRNAGMSLFPSRVQGFSCGYRGLQCAVTEPPHCITVPLFIRSLLNFYFVPFMSNFFSMCIGCCVWKKCQATAAVTTYIQNKAINSNKNKRFFCMKRKKKKKNVNMSLRKGKKNPMGK